MNIFAKLTTYEGKVASICIESGWPNADLITLTVGDTSVKIKSSELQRAIKAVTQ